MGVDAKTHSQNTKWSQRNPVEEGVGKISGAKEVKDTMRILPTASTKQGS